MHRCRIRQVSLYDDKVVQVSVQGSHVKHKSVSMQGYLLLSTNFMMMHINIACFQISVGMFLYVKVTGTLTLLVP